MKKKIVSLLTILMILISSVPSICFADDKGKAIVIDLNRTGLEDMLSIDSLSKKMEKEGYIGLMNIRGDRGTDDRRSYAAVGAGGKVTLPNQNLINFEEVNKGNAKAYKAETGHNPKKINDMTIYKRGWISMFFKNEETNKRFIIVHYEKNGLEGCKVLVDKETGVNYLYSWDGYSGGLTPLLNKDGTPIITEVNK